jgi:branched-subunit amino acid transport protein
MPMLNNRKIILLLSGLAALHVFIYSAAFPFFGVVDEQMHFDLAARYAQAQPPRTLAKTSEAALPYIVYFSCSEFLYAPASQPGGKFAPPPWTIAPEAAAERLALRAQFWRDTAQNHEASQPPVYYALAGSWWRLGGLLGLPDGWRLYSLRFLNILIIGALVWLGAGVAQKIFPENRFVQLAVPALIACLPQTIFYAINNDVLSPLIFGTAFLLLSNFWERETITNRHAAVTGLALAAAFLTKLSNLPLLAVAGFFLAWKIIPLAKTNGWKKAGAALGIFTACAALPIAAWLFWCKTNFGDFTGSALKIQFLGWTNKPFAEWFQHPIFTASGFWFFVKGNLATFWQGEMLWHREPLALPWLNVFYTLLTGGLLAVLLLVLGRRPAAFSSPQRTALWFGLACLAAMFTFLALLSVKYDFHDCFYPSREKPFFISGRLMLGMLVPFLILVAAGLDQLLGKFNLRVKFAVLATLLVFMLGTEFAANWPVFSNAYNWFHL